MEGDIVNLHRLTTYKTQADLPGAALPPEEGVYLIYLDVWQRHISASEDPDIREPALGGPDTATRTRTICQVKLLRVGNVGAEFNRDSHSDEWDGLVAPSSGTLRVKATAGTARGGELAPASANYRGLENQLYRALFPSLIDLINEPSMHITKVQLTNTGAGRYR